MLHKLLKVIIRDIETIASIFKDLFFFIISLTKIETWKRFWNWLKEKVSKIFEKRRSKKERNREAIRAAIKLLRAEPSKFIPWLKEFYAKLPNRIAAMVEEPLDEPGLAFSWWCFVWAFAYAFCYVFNLRIEPRDFALYYAQFVLFMPPVLVVCAIGTRLSYYTYTRLIFFLRRRNCFPCSSYESTVLTLVLSHIAVILCSAWYMITRLIDVFASYGYFIPSIA